MQEVLNELFYGNINPNAKQFARNSEYGRAVKIVSECEGRLLVLLSGKEPELFEKLMKALGKPSLLPVGAPLALSPRGGDAACHRVFFPIKNSPTAQKRTVEEGLKPLFCGD